MKSREQLAAAIAHLDEVMDAAARNAKTDREHWAAWQSAMASLPQAEVPADLSEWWQRQVYEAGQRAFNHPVLRERWEAGEYDPGAQRREGVGIAGGPSEPYRGYVIGIELRRETIADRWSGYVTIAAQTDPLVQVDRIDFVDLPTTNYGDDAYALVVAAAQRAVDSLLDG